MAKGGRARAAKRSVPAVKRAPTQVSPQQPIPAASPVPTLPTRAMPAEQPAAAPTLATAMHGPAATTRVPSAAPLSSTEQWISAFTRGFPYAAAEYCLFILALFGGPVVALLAGIVLVSACAVNALTQGKLVAALPAAFVRRVESFLGQRDTVLMSLGVAGAGLLLWTIWNTSGTALFSVLAIVALLSALFLMLYAQRIQTTTEI